MRISFEADGFEPIEVEAEASLSDVLDSPKSPVFFGCKSGNCGTCLVDVKQLSPGTLSAVSEEERELLDALAPDRPTARLACQLRAVCDLHLKYLH